MKPKVKTKNNNVLSEEWLNKFYSQVGREVSLAREGLREAHNWVISLSGGAIAAVWAIGGGKFQYPSEISYIVMLVLVPLVFRFFVRSCLEYQIFHRWLSLRNALDAYFFSKDMRPELQELAMTSLIEKIRLYYFQWKQPIPTSKMLRDNLLLAFNWPFILITALIVLGVILQPRTPLITYTYYLVIPMLLIEIYQFFTYFELRHEDVKNHFNIRKI